MLRPEDYKYTGIIPYRGKFAVKSADFFTSIEAVQAKKMNPEWFYKPLRFEVEITNECNIKCEHCGMNAVPEGGGVVLSDKLIHRIPIELEQVGIPSISITGGEPFLPFSKLCLLIQKCAEANIDICKITTNGYWGEDAKFIFQALVKHGLFKNKQFVPLIMISIGENVVAYEKIARIFNYVYTNFSQNELNLCISSMKEKGGNSQISEFIQAYEGQYGRFPHERFFLTERVYLNSKYNPNNAIRVETDINKYIDDCYMCFWPTVGAYVLPTLFMKASGECFSCAAFNVPDELYFGNIYKMSISEILATANKNPYVKIIAKDGLKGLRTLLGDKSLDGVCVNDYCDACKKLIDMYKEKSEIY